MRPTNLKFRSPKERTGEFLYPQIKHDGTNLELAKDKYHQSFNERFSTFSNERRFQQPNNMFVSVQTGPGSYDTQNFKTILEKINSSKRKANEPLIGKGTNLNYGYCYVDDSIVFDDTFAKLSLKRKMRRLQNYGTSQREIIDKQNQQNMRYSLKGYQDQISENVLTNKEIQPQTQVRHQLNKSQNVKYRLKNKVIEQSSKEIVDSRRLSEIKESASNKSQITNHKLQKASTKVSLSTNYTKI